MAQSLPTKDICVDCAFPIVCIGGSAGGLDAYKRLLRCLPPDLGVAVIIVNHLRTVATLLDTILPHYTTMPVELITEGLVIGPNRLFIIPEKRDLHVRNGKFHLQPISKPRGWPDVITVFLRSLATHWQGALVAVIVSGYDGDGADALSSIKEAGGITIAQRPDTASQPDMPQSAIASGWIDFVLSPEEIAKEIGRISSVEADDWCIDLSSTFACSEMKPSAPKEPQGTLLRTNSGPSLDARSGNARERPDGAIPSWSSMNAGCTSSKTDSSFWTFAS